MEQVEESSGVGRICGARMVRGNSYCQEKWKEVHMAGLFGFCVLKGAELVEGDARRKFKYRVVLQSNVVVDENWEAAIFNDLGAAPAMMEAASSCDMLGCQPGWTVEQVDSELAYV